MSDKWADYVVTEVCQGSQAKHIVAVKVSKDLGDQLSVPTTWQRQQVVSSIKVGNTFVTAKRGNGKYQKGATVHIMKVNGVEYLRTDQDARESDNLGELPRFQC